MKDQLECSIHIEALIQWSVEAGGREQRQATLHTDKQLRYCIRLTQHSKIESQSQCRDTATSKWQQTTQQPLTRQHVACKQAKQQPVAWQLVTWQPERSIKDSTTDKAVTVFWGKISFLFPNKKLIYF